jgi:ABC-type branched-subunit amino acid transport system ATPase component
VDMTTRSGAAVETEEAPLLEVSGLSRRFGGIDALVDVDLVVHRGEIVGLIGPNGAGKSTLVNCVGGQTTPSSGSVTLAGRSISRLPVFERARLGLARTFQRVEVFGELTVLEHLLLADRAKAETGWSWHGSRGDDIVPADVEATLDAVGLRQWAQRPAAALPLGQCRLLELGRALIGEPSVLLADEPSSGLDPAEAVLLADVLRTASRERELGVLLVEHDLDTVARMCDRVAVMDLGRIVAVGPYATVMADPTVRRAYLGAGQ